MSTSELFTTLFVKEGFINIYNKVMSNHYFPIGLDGINNEVFRTNLDNEINIILKKIGEKIYNFTTYKAMLISKGYDKYPRLVEKPTIRDRLVLRVLFEYLNTVYQIPLKNRKLHSQVNRVANEIKNDKYGSVIRLDIKDYFPSINHDILFKKLKNKIRKKEILYLLRKAICTSNTEYRSRDIHTRTKGIPQGLSISNILSNIYLFQVDKKYEALPQISYFRFVDDILILTDKMNCLRIKKMIFNDIQKLGLEFHTGKKLLVDDISTDFDFLGYRINNRILSIRDESISRFRISLLKIFTKMKYDANKSRHPYYLFKLNLRISGCIWNGNKYGWMFYFSQVENEKVLHSLNHFLVKQLRRYNLNELRVKNIVRVFKEINNNLSHTKYIPNFDTLSIKSIKSLLDRIDVKYKDDNDAISKYYRIIKRITDELERDMIGFTS